MIALDEIKWSAQRLGEGSFGAVFKGRFRGSDVAIKTIHAASFGLVSTDTINSGFIDSSNRGNSGSGSGSGSLGTTSSSGNGRDPNPQSLAVGSMLPIDEQRPVVLLNEPEPKTLSQPTTLHQIRDTHQQEKMKKRRRDRKLFEREMRLLSKVLSSPFPPVSIYLMCSRTASALLLPRLLTYCCFRSASPSKLHHAHGCGIRLQTPFNLNWFTIYLCTKLQGKTYDHDLAQARTFQLEPRQISQTMSSS